MTITTLLVYLAARGSVKSKAGAEVVEVGAEAAELEIAAAKTYGLQRNTPRGKLKSQEGNEQTNAARHLTVHNGECICTRIHTV